MPAEAVLHSLSIVASGTPLKRYLLKCPNCGEQEVCLPADNPETPFCLNCDEKIDLDDLKDFIGSWMEYLQDREALLQQEGGENEAR